MLPCNLCKKQCHRNFGGTTKYIFIINYLVTRSSHFTIPSITPIEMRHTTRNTVQQVQIGHALYINGPIQSNKLPNAVAPSQRP